MALLDIQERIKSAALAANRDANSIRLLAVSKTKSCEAIESVYNLGQRDFGENYADELITKAETLKHLLGIKFSFIGQLQSNKIKKLVAHADEIQTIASEKHARYVDRYASELGKSQYPVWIHVNADADSKKFGLPIENVELLATFLQEHCKNLLLQGIMAIPSGQFSDESYRSKKEIPPIYKELQRLAKGIGRGGLSLGMTNDLELAINAGSTCVRVGTAIFGERI